MFIRRVQFILCLGILGLLLSGFQNCSQKVGFQTNSDLYSESSAFVFAATSDYVCEPFGVAATNADSQAGLRASLRYMRQDQFSSQDERNTMVLANYFDQSDARFVGISQEIYFSQINTPTQTFDEGFKQKNGETLKDSQGQLLTEFFALEYDSILKLSNSDMDGAYRLASIADDGVVVELQLNGVWKTIVNGDGLHDSQMICADDVVNLDHASAIPIRVRYFQGPRNQIANVLMWQHVTSSSDPLVEVNCAQSGVFFDSAAHSAPQQAYLDLMTRGWSVIGPQNFQLPSHQVNPCSTNASSMTLNRVSLTAAVDGRVRLQFNTSVAGQAQLLLKDSNGGTLATLNETAESVSHDFKLPSLATDQVYRLELDILSSALKVSLHRSFALNPTH